MKFLGGNSSIDWLHSSPWAFLILILLYIWKNFGYCMIIFIAALNSIEPMGYEAAACDGAGFFRSFFSITLPQIVPSIFFNFIIGIIGVFKIYRESYLLMGEYPNSSVYMLQNFITNNLENLNYQRLSCSAMIFLLLMGLLVAFMLYINDKESAWR